MLRYFLGLLWFGLVSLTASAQQPADTTDVSAVVEEALQRSDAATTSEALAEWLAERVEDPLDLNTTSGGLDAPSGVDAHLGSPHCGASPRRRRVHHPLGSACH